MKKVFSLSLFFMLMVSISIFAVTKTLKSGGGGSLNWTSNGSWTQSGVPSTSDDVVIAASSNSLTIDANAICASFTIEAGYAGTITFLGSFTLTVSGDWTNSGAPALGSGSVLIGGKFTNNNASLDVQNTEFTFNGTSDQTISSASGPANTLSTFGTLTIDNPGIVTLLTDVGVKISFSTTQGQLDINGNILYVNGAEYTGPLPVELVSFSARINDTEIILNWLTATEVNNYGFEIQRSVQTDKWEVLGFVEGHGNSNSPKEYSFTDAEVNSSGIYYYRLKQIDNDGSYEFSKTIEVNFGSPISFELSQNYPNPFNPSTTISFNLPKSGVVTLKVYNLMGEEITTLAEGFREAGIHSFNFNAEGYPSGMYLYSLGTNGFTETKKMLLVK
ncbi:MAG: T9SS type A sorting domain-containing protein [Ignavibacteriaceae bacterium]|jgi:hypothetical protein